MLVQKETLKIMMALFFGCLFGTAAAYRGPGPRGALETVARPGTWPPGGAASPFSSYPHSYGAHRARIHVALRTPTRPASVQPTTAKPTPACFAAIPWRRRDVRPESINVR